MSLLASAQKVLPGLLGGYMRPHGRDVLQLRPLRQPSVAWKTVGEDNLVILTVSRRQDPWSNFAARVFGIPLTRNIELTDEISSFVWTCCDGDHAVADIAMEICKRYKLNKRQSEVSVLTFLKTLQTKHLIGVPAEQARSYKQASQANPASRAQAADARKEVGYYAGRKRSGKRTR
jgi:hypothetical protein